MKGCASAVSAALAQVRCCFCHRTNSSRSSLRYHLPLPSRTMSSLAGNSCSKLFFVAAICCLALSHVSRHTSHVTRQASRQDAVGGQTRGVMMPSNASLLFPRAFVRAGIMLCSCCILLPASLMHSSKYVVSIDEAFKHCFASLLFTMSMTFLGVQLSSSIHAPPGATAHALHRRTQSHVTQSCPQSHVTQSCPQWRCCTPAHCECLICSRPAPDAGVGVCRVGCGIMHPPFVVSRSKGV